MLYFILATAFVFGIALLNTNAVKNVFFDTGYALFEGVEYLYKKYTEATSITVYRGKTNKNYRVAR